jgi:hypothetical protein
VKTSFVAMLVVLCAGCNARMIVDGKHYNIDGSEREQPKERLHHAVEALRACDAEVRGVEQAFVKDALPAARSLAAAVARGDDASAEVAFADTTAVGPLVTVTIATAQAPAKPAKNAKKKAKNVAQAPTRAPVEPAIAALSTSLRDSLTAVEHCSSSNLNAIKVVWDEQHYISQPETHELLEAHWTATQRLARAKEIAMTSMAFALAAGEAGHGKPAPLARTNAVLESRGDKLFVDVPFVHNLRREVMIQALHDTSDGCGKKGENGKSTCDKVLGAIKTVTNVSRAVDDAKSGRIFAALDKASRLGDDEAAQEQARREAVLALIPEKPALDRARFALGAARQGDVHHARLRGLTISASDGVAELLDALEK